MHAVEAVGKMINTLDTSVAEGLMCDGVVWASQHVFEPLEGKEAVLGHLDGKYDTIRDAHCHPIAQLGFWKSGGLPDALIIEQYGAPVCTMLVDSDAEGRILKVCVCSVPSPSEVSATGILPGLTEQEAQAKRDGWLDELAALVQQEIGPVEIRGYYLQGAEAMRPPLDRLVRDVSNLMPGSLADTRGHSEGSMSEQSDDMVIFLPCIAIRRGEALVWPAFSGTSLSGIVARLKRVGLLEAEA
jgi:hypothetical protein